MGTHFKRNLPGDDFPTAWTQFVKDDKVYMFGLGSSALYAFFVTDMELVWTDTPSPDAVYKIALQKGITGFDEEKFDILKLNLIAVFRTASSDVSISSVTLLAVSAQVKISGNLTWSFNAHHCDAETTARFFRNLCCQSFSNHGFSVYRGFQLEKAIRMKDEYILYLEENYKTLNGTELMKKFRRNNPDFENQTLECSKAKFDSSVADDYLKYLETGSSGDPQSRIWKEYSLVKKDQSTWTERLQRTEISPIPSTDIHMKHETPELSPVKPEKRRRRGRSGSDEDFERPEIKPDATAMQDPAEKRVSPSKRRRIGFIGKR